MVDAGVLEESADGAPDSDSLGQPGYARPERAQPAHDQIDLDPAARCGVERADELRVVHAVELGPDASASPGAGVRRLALDPLQQSGGEMLGRDQEAPERGAGRP